MSIARATAHLSAENTFSEPVRLTGRFNFLLSGTFSATARLQRSFEDPSGTPSWHRVGDALGNTGFSGPVTFVGEEPEGAWYRFGIENGDYTSGTLSGRLSQ